MDVIVEASAAAACVRAAEEMAACVRGTPTAVLGLPTGRTPIPIYHTLADWQRAGRIDFRHVRSFNLDELVGVDSNDPRSYAAYMARHWTIPLGLNASHVHLPQTTGDLERACSAYEEALEAAGGLDLVLLGLGENGHIGFNEPGTAWDSGTHVASLAAGTRRALVEAFGSLDAVPRQAVTMGLRTILSARRCVLVATGARKAAIVARLLEQPPTLEVPASALQTHPHVAVVLDAEAAATLQR